MEILGKLFGSPARVKILRLFLFNPEEVYERKDIARHARVSSDTVSRELIRLKGIGFAKRKICYRETLRKRKGRTRKRKVLGWVLDPSFKYLQALQTFLIHATSLKENEIAKKLLRVGNLKLVVASGIFVHDSDSKIDLLIVGNGVKIPLLESAIRNIESEIGRELRYGCFTTKDFQYRLNMYDRLMRDIFDYPHHVVIDRLGLPTRK